MRAAKWGLGALVCLVVLLYAVMFWWPRPLDTTEPRVFAGDGADLNYCELPELVGNGLQASEIPKAYTPAKPNCHYTTFPMPVLANCREPIAPGFPDMRGLWMAYQGLDGHIERIEQCGDRIVVTSAGIIHDFHADGSLKNGSRDTEGPTNNCINTWVSIDVDQNAVVNFHPFGLSAVTVVKRWMEADELRWKYFKFDHVIKMKRICTLPDSHRIYSPAEE